MVSTNTPKKQSKQAANKPLARISANRAEPRRSKARLRLINHDSSTKERKGRVGMGRIKTVGACLIAVFAMGALLASGASAFVREPPEIGRCLKHAGGHWKDGGCKTAAKVASEQKFEWYPAYGEAENGETKLAEKVKFTSVSKEGTLIQLMTVSGEGIACKKQTADGEATGPKTLKA